MLPAVAILLPLYLATYLGLLDNINYLLTCIRRGDHLVSVASCASMAGRSIRDHTAAMRPSWKW